ncbi:MAG: hypothetical protein M1828_004842 [Chrysothrix sp. TS-e1954]|nr:MAG: hypothetical protein M1828_004842 [Chrysothrix sp. TS-e1954]
MPSTSHQPSSTSHASRDEMQPASGDDAPTKRDLASWWKTFKKTTKKDEEKRMPAPAMFGALRIDRRKADERLTTAVSVHPGIFGVPLQTSIRYANVAISLFDSDGRSFIYGYVPIVIAKCGVFLKERATETEGIFRLAGAERRMKELQVLFNSPDRYGKGLDWTGYTVHDAANILRRYLNQLPEPIIPLDFYTRFRQPIRGHQSQAVGEEPLQDPNDGDFDAEAAIKAYQQLITELPALNRQLLLYILDLLAVFASKSDLNRMTAPNLSAIFQPALLRHPTHDMAPKEYRLNQDVLIFLIDNQDHFLVGMQGTAADEKTIQDVQSGAAPAATTSNSPPTTRPATQTIGRSSSNASAGAESIRRQGGLRRNVSLSSRRSGYSAHTPSPVTPPPDSPYSSAMKTGGVHRSNTVPSKRQPSPALAATHFQREKPSDQGESNVGMTTATVISPLPTGSPGHRARTGRETFATSRNASASNPPAERMSPHLRPVPTHKGRTRSHDRQLHVDMPPSPPGNISPLDTPSRERTFSSFFNKSPAIEVDRRDTRRPNKLQKRRPDAAGLNAQTSNASLSGASYPPSPAPFSQNQDAQTAPTDSSITAPREASGQTTDGYESAMEDLPPPVVAPKQMSRSPGSSTTETATLGNFTTLGNAPASQTTTLKDMPHRTSGTTLKAGKTSPDSLTSRSIGHEVSTEHNGTQQSEEQETKHLSHHESKQSGDSDQKPTLPSSTNADPASGTGRSPSSVGSIPPPKKSPTDDSSKSTNHGGQHATSDTENGTHSSHGKGPIAWFRGKRQERKEKEAEKERTKSPSKERSGSTEGRQQSHTTESAQ